MFTGIIEEIGTIESLHSTGKSGQLQVRCHRVLEGTRIGDSIAVSGICLTVTSLSPDSFTADVSAQTVRQSSLGGRHAGDRVNLERAMAADGRFGGHLVSGHIDGTGTVLSLRREENALWLRIGAEPDLMALIVERGSVAVDGVSLTVARLDDAESFSVCIIPHTAEETTLLFAAPGDAVNLENDMIGKYVRRLLGLQEGHGQGTSGGLTYEDLVSAGF